MQTGLLRTEELHGVAPLIDCEHHRVSYSVLLTGILMERRTHKTHELTLKGKRNDNSL
jgi:hypothetical protein